MFLKSLLDKDNLSFMIGEETVYKYDGESQKFLVSVMSTGI